MNRFRIRSCMRRAGSVVPALAVALLAAGCGSSVYTGPVASFSETYEAAAPILGRYFSEMNSFEREIYLRCALYNDADINGIDGSGPTPLMQGPFSSESVRARLDAIRLIGAYTGSLAALAGSDAPMRIGAAMGGIGSTLDSLQQAFEELAGSHSDPTAGRYAGPIGSLVGIVVQSAAEEARDSLVTIAVRQGSGPVAAILDQLESDFRNVVIPQVESGLVQLAASLIRYYNDHRTGMTFSERRELLAEIDRVLQRRDALASADPAGLIRAMRDANEALYRFSLSDERDRVTLDALVSAMNVFSERVRSAADAIEQLQR